MLSDMSMMISLKSLERIDFGMDFGMGDLYCEVDALYQVVSTHEFFLNSRATGYDQLIIERTTNENQL